MKLLGALLLSLSAGAWQQPPPPTPAQPPAEGASSVTETEAEKQERDLDVSLAEAGSSPVEYARALENHLKKYPNSPRRKEIERVLSRAAVDLKDKRRLIEFGVPVIESGAADLPVLEHVTRALLDRATPEDWQRASRYARRLQELADASIADLRKPGELQPGAGRRLDDREQIVARALIFQSRAAGLLDRKPEAISTAQQAFNRYPSAEAAREAARWLEAAGRLQEALEWQAQAMIFPDPRNASSLQAADRERLNALNGKLKGSSASLGEIVLAAYDRNAAALAERANQLRAFDPNFDAAQPSDFTLTGLRGEKLSLASLKGKVAVLDFWATWCGPCRGQYPLYEQVKKRFKDRSDVVFLAVSTDEDRSLVEPFLSAQRWHKNVFFDDGLGALLRINSIPTTVILGRDGAIASRLNGYVVDRFVDMLSTRIEWALVE